MRLWWLTPWLIMLAGCQAAPSVLPAAEPRPAPECRWEAGDTPAPDWVRRALTALENEGFVVRHTALGLGLVSADRTQVLPAYGDFHDDWEGSGFYGGYGVGVGGGRGGFSTGLMIGFGGGVGSVTRDATRLERVSLVADADWVRLTRDIQVIDWRGDLRETRSASDADFCLRLRQVMTATAAPAVGEGP
ncbi:hypothetical protein [Halomonas sp. E14]|uniref:hypothetical protein n=1 Tax=Halomonas sp. E14 TaxID=3397245 RepID=UPI00403E7DD7